MARILPLSDAEAAVNPSARAALDASCSVGGRVTNMKRTLAREPVALRSLLTWYDLRDVVQPFFGERLTRLFAHAISTRADCLVCSKEGVRSEGTGIVIESRPQAKPTSPGVDLP